MRRLSICKPSPRDEIWIGDRKILVSPAVGSALSWIGKLPGDLSIRREQFSIYIPIATSLVLSILLSLVLYILSWLFRR